MVEFDERRLMQKLEHLSDVKQLAFMLFLCERLMPALVEFCKEADVDEVVFRNCLSEAWRSLISDIRPPNYDELVHECLSKAPDTENFDHCLTSAALSAVVALAATLDFVIDQNISHTIEAARTAFDTAVLYAENSDSSVSQPRALGDIIKRQLVQKELRRQEEDLSFLELISETNRSELNSFIVSRAREMPSLLS